MRARILAAVATALLTLPLVAHASSGVPPAASGPFVRLSPDLRVSVRAVERLASPQPVTGVQPILVIFVYFADVAPKVPVSGLTPVLEEVRRYYSEVSYGQAYIEWVCYNWSDPWLKLPHAMAYYGANSATEVDVRGGELVRDSLSAADPYVDYREFSYVVIVHAGGDEAMTGDADDIWSSAYIGEKWSTNDGVVQLNVAVVSETDFVGVLAHELGHLFWLPDLYDYAHKVEFVGYWDPMAEGCCVGPKHTPSQFTSWCRIKLGWLEGHAIATVAPGESLPVDLAVLESPTGVKCVKVPLSGERYYLIEARERRGFDRYLPDEGVLILLVDESKESGEGIVRVVDSTPGDNDVDNGAWKVGQTFFDAASGLKVSVTSASDSTYTLRVEYAVAVGEAYVEVKPPEAAPGDAIEVFVKNPYPIYSASVYLEDQLLTVVPVEGNYEVKARVLVPSAAPGEYTVKVLVTDSKGRRYGFTKLTVTASPVEERIEAISSALKELSSDVDRVESAVNRSTSTVVSEVSKARVDTIEAVKAAESALAAAVGEARADVLTEVKSGVTALKTEFGKASEKVASVAKEVSGGLAAISASVGGLSEKMEELRVSVDERTAKVVSTVEGLRVLMLATLGVAALSAALAAVRRR